MSLTKVSRNLLSTSIVDNGNSTAITIDSSENVQFSGTISASGYNNSNWDTAYSWGNHASQSYATQSYVNTQVANLVDSAPSTLDTLNELASALGDDANFSTTVTNSIGTKWTQDNTKISNWDTAYSWGNHASAGYLMDSELTSEASVKALNQGVATTDSPSFVKLTAKHDTADQLQIGDTTDTNFWTLRAGTNLLFKDNGTERMRIDSSGRVGIGTANPDYSLTIFGDDPDIRQEMPSTSSSNLIQHFFTVDGVQEAQVVYNKVSGSEYFGLRTTKDITFQTGGSAERMRIDSSGNTTFNGNVSIDQGTSGDATLTLRADTDNNDEGDHPQIRFQQDGDLVSYRFGIGTSASDVSTANNDLCITAEGSGSSNLFMVTTAGVQHKFWHAGNDGSGSGLDADLFQGYGQTASGNRWGVMAPVGTDGVMEIGRYIDFHSTDGDTNDFNIRLDGSSNRVTLTTSHGYVQLGAQNSTYAHFYTDRGKYYFNKRLIVDEGIVSSHNEDLKLRRANSSSYQMTLSTSGATFTHNVTAYSDGRLKEDVKPIENALDTVEKLEGVTYTRKDNQEKNIGFIAQQIEEACPELAERVVGEMDDERKTKHVNYANMVALLVEAVKELKAEVDELKAAQ